MRWKFWERKEDKAAKLLQEEKVSAEGRTKLYANLFESQRLDEMVRKSLNLLENKK